MQSQFYRVLNVILKLKNESKVSFGLYFEYLSLRKTYLLCSSPLSSCWNNDKDMFRLNLRKFLHYHRDCLRSSLFLALRTETI